MKTNKILFSTTAVALLVAIASITFYSCKKKPFDDINVIANSNFTTATIGVIFSDAKTGEPVGWDDSSIEVEVEIIGKDADKIVSVMNSNDFTVGKGLLALALAEGVTASATAPIKFTIVAKADGFIPVSHPITVFNEGGINVSIPMISINNGLEGVAVKVDNTSLGSSETNGVTGTTSTISISSGAASSGSDITTATIDIPTGQMFYTDASHSERITEALEVTFAKFSAIESASLANFPGSLLDATFSDNTTKEFITAGLISLEMKTASGKEVTSFEKPITVTTGIPAGIIKEDGTEVVAGDTIPVWSHSKTTGHWTYEGNCTVVDNEGTLETTYNITHLSYWNIDRISYNERCEPGAKINFTGNVEVASNDYNLILYDENGNFLNYSKHVSTKNGSTITMNRSANKNVFIQVYKNSSSFPTFRTATQGAQYSIGKSNVFQGCTGVGTVEVLDPAYAVKVTVNVTCGDDAKTYRPTFPVFAADKTEGEWFPQPLGNVVNGVFQSTSLVEGHTYTVYVYYNNDIKTKDITIDSKDVTVELELSKNACNTLNIN